MKTDRRIAGLHLQSFEDLSLLQEKTIRLHEMFKAMKLVRDILS